MSCQRFLWHYFYAPNKCAYCCNFVYCALNAGYDGRVRKCKDFRISSSCSGEKLVVGLEGIGNLSSFSQSSSGYFQVKTYMKTCILTAVL